MDSPHIHSRMNPHFCHLFLTAPSYTSSSIANYTDIPVHSLCEAGSEALEQEFRERQNSNTTKQDLRFFGKRGGGGGSMLSCRVSSVLATSSSSSWRLDKRSPYNSPYPLLSPVLVEINRYVLIPSRLIVDLLGTLKAWFPVDIRDVPWIKLNVCIVLLGTRRG